MPLHGDLKSKSGTIYVYNAKSGSWMEVIAPRVEDGEEDLSFSEEAVAAGMKVIAEKLYARAKELHTQASDLAFHDGGRSKLFVSADTMRATAEWLDPDHERNLLP